MPLDAESSDLSHAVLGMVQTRPGPGAELQSNREFSNNSLSISVPHLRPGLGAFADSAPHNKYNVRIGRVCVCRVF